jgi:hypothetical protein
MNFMVSGGHSALSFSPMQLPPRYHEMIWPMIEKAKGFLEKGEKLSPLAFVGNFDTGQAVPILIDTLDDSRKDASAVAIRITAESIAADYVFTILEGWGLPKDKMSKHEDIIERYGSIGASPYKIDTANFMLETRYGVWGAQVPLKFMAPSKKRRTFTAPAVLIFMSGIEGRFAGLLPAKPEGGTSLH